MINEDTNTVKITMTKVLRSDVLRIKELKRVLGENRIQKPTGPVVIKEALDLLQKKVGK